MNVAELIEKLKALPPELKVITWDDEAQVVAPLDAMTEVGIGEFGHNLTLAEGGTPALLLLNEAQNMETILEGIEEMGEMMAALEEGDPSVLHGKHSMGITGGDAEQG